MRDFLCTLSSSGTIHFSPGDKIKTLNVSIISNDKCETEEYFLVQLLNSTGYLMSESRIMIIDDNIDVTSPTGMQEEKEEEKKKKKKKKKRRKKEED